MSKAADAEVKWWAAFAAAAALAAGLRRDGLPRLSRIELSTCVKKHTASPGCHS